MVDLYRVSEPRKFTKSELGNVAVIEPLVHALGDARKAFT